MTEAQAAEIIALLKSIDDRLKSVIEGESSVDVTVLSVKDSVEIYGNVTAYDPR